jgi:hypothetical protein
MFSTICFTKFFSVWKLEIGDTIIHSSLVHCKYIGRRNYDILSCLIYHRNLVVICTVDGWVQPMAAAVFDYSHS